MVAHGAYIGVVRKFFLDKVMIKSKFISDILDLILDGDVRNQKDYLTEKDYEYTGVGLFVNFSQRTAESRNNDF